MDYPYENLGPERFQQFCQALLVLEFPNVQCFPVAQPDGGRDAVSFYSSAGEGKFMVFQVKFSRKPLAEADPHNWLLQVTENEIVKVQKLIPRGATSYYLMTNVPGTAHSEVGSIDKLNKELTDNIGVPSQCWWRDDLNRRLDGAWSLKWAYPELMVGPDFLRAIVESGLTEHKERRAAAIKAFLRAQYDADEHVRFKQVELENKLLDLFIDVPIVFRDVQAGRKRLYRFHHEVRRSLSKRLDESDDQLFESMSYPVDLASPWRESNEDPLGAATLLLSPLMQEFMPKSVIEGAPGQGKSTIAQYVCQVHRMKLLQEEEATRSIPEDHRKAPPRLPIKVDLRDLAMWCARRDPFNVEHTSKVPINWSKSLESFLAAQIAHQSGGTLFTVDDLLAVLKISSVFLAFDGLDEVADIPRRREVVEEIVRGVQRLEANAASLQTIVTSRPAAFANSPGMPHAKYPHFQLESLSRSLIMTYADRWLSAKRLGSKQSADFRLILKAKLDQPHLRDLARNPMQLTILLTLVHTRGASLPDKRTALYYYYVDLFFSREAEKSEVVRDHRDLLLDIHRYLAWELHSQVELGNPQASVTEGRLHEMVKAYLVREGHDPDLAKQLFTGMVERVVALVSRVQGTYEFEVQPLREYFAACHLYYTAPQSSPGREKPGSKPDRFDGIVRNFYWLNVTRFYAGCYNKGELPSLVERLHELSNNDGFRFISYPRTLAASLLGDWVFTQNPRSVQQVVDLILDGVGLRYVLASFSSYRRRAHGNPLVLPPRCGREELVSRCFEMLHANPPEDIRDGLVEVLQANSENMADITVGWTAHYEKECENNRLRWLEYGVRLGIVWNYQPRDTSNADWGP